MEPKLVVAVSLRQRFYWDLHRMIEAAHDSRERFIHALLERAGVPSEDQSSIAKTILARIPKRLDRLDVGKLTTILEELSVLGWKNDVRPVHARATQELSAAIITILESVVRPGARPKLVAEDVVAAARRILGDLVDEEAAARLHTTMEGRLANDLWRCQGTESNLAAYLMSDIAEIARVEFG